MKIALIAALGFGGGALLPYLVSTFVDFFSRSQRVPKLLSAMSGAVLGVLISGVAMILSAQLFQLIPLGADFVYHMLGFAAGILCYRFIASRKQ